MLRTLIDGLTNRPEVTGVAIVSAEGLVIDQMLPPATDGDALAALVSNVVRDVDELGHSARLGVATTVILEFAGGAAILGLVDGGAALVVLARAEADLGELLYLVRRHRPAVAEAL